jgi:hypothetical protein
LDYRISSNEAEKIAKEAEKLQCWKETERRPSKSAENLKKRIKEKGR